MEILRIAARPKSYEIGKSRAIKGALFIATGLIAYRAFKRYSIALTASSTITALLSILPIKDNAKAPSGDHPHVVIVGAGPTGLATAIDIKDRCPTANITILEKRECYVRNQVVFLAKRAFKRALKGGTLESVSKTLDRKIPIKTIESRLKEAAVQKGILIKTFNVENPNELTTLYPNTSIFIGADGAKSLVRRTLFPEMQTDQVLNRLCQVKYKVEGTPQKLSTIDAFSNKFAMGTLATEHVGSNNTVTLNLFIGQNEFQQMGAATFSDPFALSDKQVDQLTRQRVEIWLDRRGQRGEKRIGDSETLTVFPLSVYRSKTFATRREQGQTFCLVGDAAFGVPYFRALNNGFDCASRLGLAVAEALTTPDMPLNGGLAASLHHYSRAVHKLANGEILKARMKSKVLNGVESSVRTVGLMHETWHRKVKS